MTDRPLTLPAYRLPALERMTQYRMILRHKTAGWTYDDACAMANVPPVTAIRPGDRYWVREAWGLGLSDHGDCPRYKATMDYRCGGKIESDWPFTWRPAITMPRWASRYTLTAGPQTVKRLQEVTEEEALLMGLSAVTKDGALWKFGLADKDGLPGKDNVGWHWKDWLPDAKKAVATLWTADHGPGVWDANPFCLFAQVEEAQI